MKKLISKVLPLLAAVLALASCSKEQAAIRLIPEDAAIVMSVDVKQSADIMGINAESKAVEKIKNFVTKNVNDDDLREKLEAAFDNFDETGIDISQPVYFYLAADMENFVGLVGSTQSAKKMSTFIDAFADESGFDTLSEDDGIYYTNIHGLAVIFNDDWFYFGPVTGDIEEQADHLEDMAENGKASILKNEDFVKMQEMEGIAKMLVSGKGIQAGIDLLVKGRQGKEIRQLLKGLPGDLSDIAIIANGVAEGKEFSGTAQVLPHSDEWEKAIKEFDAMLGDVSSELTQYMDASSIVALANVRGDKLYDIIAKAVKAFTKEAPEEMLGDIRNIVTSFDGNIGLSLSSISSKGEPNLFVYLATKDSTLLNTIREGEDSEDMKINADGSFMVTKYDWDFDDDTYELVKGNAKNYTTYGYQNGYTYIVHNEDSTQMPFSKPAEPFKAGNVKGKGFYFRMSYDFYRSLADYNNGFRHEDVINEMTDRIADFGDYVEMYYEGNGKFTSKGVYKKDLSEMLDLYVTLLAKYM